MKKIKLLFALVFVFILAFALASCNGGDSEQALSGTQISSKTLTLSAEVLSGRISSANETFSFADDLSVAKGASFSVSKNADGSNAISGATELAYGNNRFYITVKNGDKTQTYTANIYRINSYTVSFNSDGGSEIPSQLVEEGALAVRPAEDPQKQYYSFDGYDFDFNNPISADVVINVKWDIRDDLKPYEVTFNSIGITINSVKSAYKSKESLVIPSDVVQISAEAFKGCNKITSIVIPEKVFSIESKAFENCSSLQSITFKEGELNSIGSSAFLNCVSLTSVDIPASVKMIGSSAFNGCRSMVSMDLPFIGGSRYCSSGARSDHVFGYIFGSQAFEGASKTSQRFDTFVSYIPDSLRHITIKSGEVGEGAFHNLKYVESIVLEPEVKVGTNFAKYEHTQGTFLIYTFAHCTNLKLLVLPSVILAVEESCFHASLVEKIYYYGTAEQIASVEVAEYNLPFKQAEFYYYSEEQPTAEGNFWHFDANGAPVAW